MSPYTAHEITITLLKLSPNDLMEVIGQEADYNPGTLRRMRMTPHSVQALGSREGRRVVGNLTSNVINDMRRAI
jgi:hypothetical protein